MGDNYYNARAFGVGFGAMNPDAAVQSQTTITPTPGEIAYQKATRVDPLVATLLAQRVMTRVETVGQAVGVLSAMEEYAVEVANGFFAQHNLGAVALADYAKYDAFRHRVYNTQVRYHRATRAALYASVGRTVGDQLMARVPWPTWLPAVRPETPRNVPPIDAGGDIRGLGVAQFVLVGAAILVVLALVAVALYFSSDIIDALEDAYVTYAQSRALDRLLQDRMEVYTQCTARGGTPEQCMAVVNQAFSPAELERFFERTAPGKGPIWYLGLAVVLLGVGAAGWWTYKTFYRPKSSMNGLGRAQRLRGLDDPTPSRYALEVDR